MRHQISAVLLCAFLATGSAFSEEKPLTNEGVIALVRAGLDTATIVLKIGQTGRAGFDTSVDGLIALKKANVPKTIIDAMLGVSPSAPGGLTATSAMGKADVQLIATTGVVVLESLVGRSSSTYIFVGFKMWLNFDKPQASVRTTDSKPTLRVKSPQRPDSRWFIVRSEEHTSELQSPS